MQSSRVSVVIPTYNYGAYLVQAVESVLHQSCPPHQVIVVDDGSTDDTGLRMAVYKDRLEYIYQPNSGLSAARNTGIDAAKGDYIALLDSDDAFHPRKLELQSNYLDANPEIGLIGSACYSDADEVWPDIPESLAVRFLSLDSLVMRSRFCPSSAMVRRRLCPVIGPFDSVVSAAADRDFWIRAGLVTRVAIMDAPLVFYRIHPQSMTRNVDLMVAHENAVIAKTFCRPELGSRRWLRRKVKGLAAASAAYMLLCDTSNPRRAASKLIQSLLEWPLPFYRPDVPARLFRPRLIARCIKDMFIGRTGR